MPVCSCWRDCLINYRTENKGGDFGGTCLSHEVREKAESGTLKWTKSTTTRRKNVGFKVRSSRAGPSAGEKRESKGGMQPTSGARATLREPSLCTPTSPSIKLWNRFEGQVSKPILRSHIVWLGWCNIFDMTESQGRRSVAVGVGVTVKWNTGSPHGDEQSCLLTAVVAIQPYVWWTVMSDELHKRYLTVGAPDPDTV